MPGCCLLPTDRLLPVACPLQTSTRTLPVDRWRMTPVELYTPFSGTKHSGREQVMLKRNTSWLWLAAAVGLGMLAGGPRPLALAVWLAPIALLRFLRLNGSWRGFGAAGLASGLGAFVVGRGFVPLPNVALLPMLLLAGYTSLVPFLVDRLLARRVDGLLATLVLPTAAVSWALLDAYVMNPYGSWGSPVYTQAESPALLQSAAFVGIWGLLFLINWIASVVNWAWERGFRPAEIAGGARLFGAVLLVALLGGGAQAAFVAPPAERVIVATVVPSNQQLFAAMPYEAVVALMQGQTPPPEQLAALRTGMSLLADELFAKSAQAAQGGAKIVAWPEGSLYLLADDEAALQSRAATLARNEGLYLTVAYAVFHPGAKHENKALIFDPEGQLALEYHKSKLVPFAEDGLFVRGDGRLPTLDTPYGRIAVAICHDQDHHEFVAQAGRQGVDILLIPTGDWKAIDRAHQNMGIFRAVEQGITVVRATRGGLSSVIDPQGRVLASLDRADVHFNGTLVEPPLPAEVSVMVGRAPTSGVPTLYRIIGDAPAWACVLALLALAGTALLRRRVTVRVPVGAGA